MSEDVMSEGIERRCSLYGFEFREHDMRRVDPSVCRTYDIKQLWQRTHEILRLALLGHKSTKIAELLDITPQTVSNTLNSDLGMRKLSAMRLERDAGSVDMAKEVNKLLPKALKVYEQLLDDEKASAALRKETADTIVLDIAGHRSPAKISGQIAHAHVTLQEIEEIKKRGRAALSDVIDITPNEEKG